MEMPELVEHRSPDGDGQRRVSSHDPLKGLLPEATEDSEQQAGPTAWEPQGVRTTSRNRVEKGAADAAYGALEPGSCPDEAQQKGMGLLPKSSDTDVFSAGSEPADAHQIFKTWPELVAELMDAKAALSR